MAWQEKRERALNVIANELIGRFVGSHIGVEHLTNKELEELAEILQSQRSSLESLIYLPLQPYKAQHQKSVSSDVPEATTSSKSQSRPGKRASHSQ